MYISPSEFLHGAIATNCGIVNGIFLTLFLFMMYRDPVLGSGRKYGALALDGDGTLIIGSSFETHLNAPDIRSTAVKLPSWTE